MGSEGRLACTSCGGAYTIEGARSSGHVLLRCTSCGFEERAQLILEDVTKPSPVAAAKAERTEARTETKSEAPKRSAAALLDDASPTREPRHRLSLASEPILPPAKQVLEAEPKPAEAKAAAARPDDVEMTPSGRTIAELPSDELVDAPPSTADVTKAGLAHIALAEDDDEPPPSEDDAEPISLSDVQVVKSPTPLPPKAGELKTLPPSLLSAPPPTIEVRTPSKPPPAVAEKETAPKERKKDAKPRAAERETKTRDRETKPRERPAVRKELDEPESRGPWTTVAAVLGMVAVVWLGARVVSGTPSSGAEARPDPNTTTGGGASSTTAASTTTTTATAEPPAPPPSASAARVVDVPETALVSTRVDSSASAQPVVATADTPVATAAVATAAAPRNAADLLERAARARRGGDLPKARALYTQALEVHPGDVEANAGLGEVARATKDLAAAKKSFQDALATSPSYYPALLGLGDTLWELGDKGEAGRLYARVVELRGDSAPAQARERASGGASAPPARPPVPLVTALPPSPPPPTNPGEETAQP